MPLQHFKSHKDLKEHAQRMSAVTMRDLFHENPDRFSEYSVQGPHLFLDYSKNRIDQAVWDSLLELAQEANIKTAAASMFAGDTFNNTEKRAVLHTALRSSSTEPLFIDGDDTDLRQEIQHTKQRIFEFLNLIHTGDYLGYSGKQIDTLVSIGIGGSYLGPVLVNDALAPYAIEGLQTHFVANIDSTDLAKVLSKIDPETTLFVVQSKSFGTQETLENANAARAWFLDQGATDADIATHFLAVSANTDKAAEFGITASNVFPMWDWVGGRYSLWSAIGLPIAFQIGPENFEALLAGAEAMDKHFLEAPADANLPMILALLGIWYSNYQGAQSQAVITYDEYLQHLPNYLQQLDMESNGKSVARDGSSLEENSGITVWGGVGANGQHAYHQLLHQGSLLIPVDFIFSKTTHHPIADHHTHLVANCMAQSQALMAGKTLAEAKAELQQAGKSESEVERLAPHKVIAGNKPSNSIVMEELKPESLGALIALYEHKVFTQGVIWGINSFDQWGVELGKSLETGIYAAIKRKEDLAALDSSTQGLINLVFGQ